MPLGFERLNEKTQRPNAQINFIKPLTTRSPVEQEIAKDFLERIAAQCFLVMKKHYISVMALEEFPYNREFLGRNFNAGEVIQLVLKDRHGNWLSFKFVQMVMMHELAHCKQMNHSRFFWKERNLYADQMKELWDKGYTGEGLWGKGKALANGRVVHDRMPEQGDVPEHLCGGTYRRAGGRKRKRGQDGTGGNAGVSYAERQQKRIAKKFGVHGAGNAVGEDELVRGGLEQKHRHQGKPKVAKSKRGRELRASAALARFEHAKKRSEVPETTQELEDDQSTDDEWSDSDNDGPASKRGEAIKDSKGHQMVQVCGDESEQLEGGQDEVNELRMMGSETDQINAALSKKGSIAVKQFQKDMVVVVDEDTESDEGDLDQEPRKCQKHARRTVIPAQDGSETESANENKGVRRHESTKMIPPLLAPTDPDVHTANSLNNTMPLGHASVIPPAAPERNRPLSVSSNNHSAHVYPPLRTASYVSHPDTLPAKLGIATTADMVSTCPVCSLDNDASAATCMACSNVLKPVVMRNHWLCRSETCRDSKYINSGDVGRCGVCGEAKQMAVNGDRGAEHGRAVGVIGADVLRWD